MTKYFIQKVKKDDNDNIIAVKTKYFEFETKKVIEKIDEGEDKFVVEKDGTEVIVKVMDRQGKKYIKTVKDETETNNLDELPEF